MSSTPPSDGAARPAQDLRLLRRSRAADLLAPLAAVAALFAVSASDQLADSAFPAAVAALTLSLMRVGAGMRPWEQARREGRGEQVHLEVAVTGGALLGSVLAVVLGLLGGLLDSATLTIVAIVLTAIAAMALVASIVLAGRARRAWRARTAGAVTPT